MSNDQKLNELSPEEKKIREILSKRFNRRAYWTLKEGINHFLPVEYRNNFPLQGIINHSLFETIKRDVETQRLETVNSVEEIKQILNYDPVADFEKFKSRRSELRKAKMRFRNLKRGRSVDIKKKLSFDEIKGDRLEYFCSKIKIKPEILIIYIIKNVAPFSSEIVIPPKLEDISVMLKKLADIKPEQVKNKTNQNHTFPGEQINSWEELEIILISNDMVEIRVQNKRLKLSFVDLGMAHKQNEHKAKKVWNALKQFAFMDGKIPNSDCPDARLVEGKERSIELNRCLKKFFNVNDSIYKNHYRVGNCWETKFKTSSQVELNTDR